MFLLYQNALSVNKTIQFRLSFHLLVEEINRGFWVILGFDKFNYFPNPIIATPQAIKIIPIIWAMLKLSPRKKRSVLSGN